MTLQHFQVLSQNNQHRNLLLNGEFIMSRDTEKGCILLFQLDEFYVEICFDQDCNKILFSRSFQDTDELYPYLEKIDISALLL
jgi:hypothetical protein